MKKTTLFIILTSVALAAKAQRGVDTIRNFYGSIANSNARTELFDDINFGGYELLATSIKYSEKNSLQKVVFSPFKLMYRSTIFKDSKLNFAQKDGVSTVGFAFGFDNTNPFNNSNKVRNAFSKTKDIPTKREQNNGESDEEYKKYISEYNNKLDEIRRSYMKNLAKNSFTISAGYNISLFEIIGGDKILNDDSLIANQFQTKAHSFSVDISYGLNENIGFNAGFSYIKKRKSAVEDQKMIKYTGGNFTVTWRAIRLADQKKLEKNSDYIKSFFIPSILFGCSFEYLSAKGDSVFFEDGIKYQHIITPFLDFKISPKSQFRLGVPIKKFETVNKNQIGLGPFVQYSLSLANSE